MLRRTTLLFAVCALSLASCTLESREEADLATRSTDQPLVEHLTTPEQEAMGFPFSEAVRVGDMLYLSGQVGNVPGTTQLVEGGIQGETRQTLENIKAVVERYGSSMDRVVKCTVMIEEMSEWPAMNEIYATYFPGPKPARSALGADGLALDARVEIECWATVG
jgi:2-iminobutanoate/2-iminopropanoate deaminase